MALGHAAGLRLRDYRGVSGEKVTCPECGSDRVTTIVVPRPAAEREPGKPGIRRAWRCLRCDAQWL